MDSNTKSGEPNIPQSQENIPQLCKGQCGFFGSSDNQGFCSVCFKKEVQKQNKSEEKKDSASESPQNGSGSVTDAMADLMKPAAVSPSTMSSSSTLTSPTTATSSPSPSSPIASDINTVKEATPEIAGAKDNERGDGAPPAKKQKKKCGICKKKLGLTGFECRCGHFYCGIHRYSDQHSCPFDYKSDGRKLIAAQNPAVRGDKIAKL
jgi:hypothetical protein